MIFDIVPLKMKQDPVSGAGNHSVDPEGKATRYLIDVDRIISIRPFTEEDNVFEVTFEVGSSFRTVVVYFDSIEELQTEINNFSK